MAKRDKDGNWEFNDEEQAQIEILARARVRARRLITDEDAAEAAKKCELCGKDKTQGEHGEGKCKPKEKKGGIKNFGE